MEKQLYKMPQMEVKEIETELFLCESLVMTSTEVETSEEILSKEHKSYDIWGDEED